MRGGSIAPSTSVGNGAGRRAADLGPFTTSTVDLVTVVVRPPGRIRRPAATPTPRPTASVPRAIRRRGTTLTLTTCGRGQRRRKHGRRRRYAACIFERFTERARQAVVLAQDEARTLRHNYIGTE